MTTPRNVLASVLVTGLALGTWPAAGAQADAQAHDATHTTIWVTGSSLMPAWGFYPNGSTYGGTTSLGKYAAWTAAGGRHRLTWVADVPAKGTYHVWVRRYGGYGLAVVSVDEQPVTGGRGGPGGGRYVWRHLGTRVIGAGGHHVDVTASGMFDALLVTTRATFNPAKDALPKPVPEPVLRTLRTYRDDSSLHAQAGRRGFVVGTLPHLYDEVLYDWVPSPDAIGDCVCLWGAPNQYINGTFAVRVLQADKRGPIWLAASLTELVGPNRVKLGPDHIDLRVVQVRRRKNWMFCSSPKPMLVPELLLRTDCNRVPPGGHQGGFGGGACQARVGAHQSRQFWLTVHLPAGTPPGVYRGQIDLGVLRAKHRRARVRVELEALPVDLKPAEGYYSIYYPIQSIRPGRSNYVPPDCYVAALKDMVRHGLNSVTLYGGYRTLPMARQAGMTRAPCLMHWPDSTAPGQVAEAKKMGFDDLYYYGVDEPNTPAQITRCRKEAERRLKVGLHMMTAINSHAAQAATRDVIDRPVYNLYVFGGPNNAAAMYVRAKGYRPISYWTTATAYPLWFRAMTGLYNRACGYLGSAPWSYQDLADERAYDPNKTVHKVAYPDDAGLPIPTLAWEAHRAGIDDVRYLEALERVIAAADKRLAKPGAPPGLNHALAQARQVRKKHYESIRGRWFQYLCHLHPGDLDQSRRALADAVVALNRAIPRSADERCPRVRPRPFP